MKKGDCSQPQLATHSWPFQGRTTFYWFGFGSKKLKTAQISFKKKLIIAQKG
jgi:hypothetical protein